MIQYCNHPHDTQTSEALNQATANVAPKSVLLRLYKPIQTDCLSCWCTYLGALQFFELLFVKV